MITREVRYNYKFGKSFKRVGRGSEEGHSGKKIFEVE